MSGADWLREQARVCHELAVARGKYQDDFFSAHNVVEAAKNLAGEVVEFTFALGCGPLIHSESDEFGDILANALSLAYEAGIDPAQALADAQERNRKRAEEGVE